jgi:predicted PurR-regulated permease PerM
VIDAGEAAMMMYGSDMMIGYVTAWHLIALAIIAALILYPIGRILQRIGFSPFWSVIVLVPFANLIGLWVVAVVPWPREERAAAGVGAPKAV